MNDRHVRELAHVIIGDPHRQLSDEDLEDIAKAGAEIATLLTERAAFAKDGARLELATRRRYAELDKHSTGVLRKYLDIVGTGEDRACDADEPTDSGQEQLHPNDRQIVERILKVRLQSEAERDVA